MVLFQIDKNVENGLKTDKNNKTETVFYSALNGGKSFIP